MDKTDSLATLLSRASPPPKLQAEPADEPDPDALSISQMDGRYSTLRPAN